jgi:hypothetical protein
MMTFSDLASVPSNPPAPLTDQLRLASSRLPGSLQGLLARAHRIRSALLPHLVRRARPGPAGRAAGPLGAVHPVDARDPPVQVLHRIPAVLGHGRVLPHLRPRRHLAALTRRARPPPRRITHARVHAPAVRGLAHRPPGITEPIRFRPSGHARAAGLADLQATGADIADLGEAHGRRVLRVCGKGTKIILVPLPPAVARAIDRAIGSRARGADPAEYPRLPDGPARRHPSPAAPRRERRPPDRQGTPAHAPPHLHHDHASFDAGADLHDVPIAARHADPRTTMRYDRARNNLDRHPNYILAAYMASGT